MTTKAEATQAAAVLLDYLGQLDPTFKDRIQITRDEFHYDDLQVAGSYIANQLEAGMHTILPRHPFFEPGFEPQIGDVKCSHCHKSFRPAYPGQPLCSNECAIEFHKRR